MSNPALIVLSKMVNESCYFTVEDNLGEAIHIHYADGIVNTRMDLTIDEFFEFCDEVEIILNGLLDGVAVCADFDENFLIGLAPIIKDLTSVSYGSVMLEDLQSARTQEDGALVLCPLREGRLSRAFNGDDSENDAYTQINLYHPKTATIQTNRERLEGIYERVKQADGFLDGDYVTLFNDTNCIFDGQHRAASLLELKGNCEVNVRRLFFRKDSLSELPGRVGRQANIFSHIKEVHEHLVPVNELKSQIINCHYRLSARDQQVEHLEQQLTNRDEQLADCKEQIEIYKQGEDILEKQLANRDEQLVDCKEQINAYIQHISTRDEQIIDRNRQIEHLDRQVANRDEQIADRDQQIADRDEQIADRDQQIADRDEKIANRDEQIVNRDEQIADKNQQIANRDEQIAEYKQQIANRDQQIIDCKQQIAEHETTIAAILQSTSWRITKPLRAVMRTIRRGR